MGTIASQITSLTIVYSTVYSDADQRKHQSSASLAFVWGIHRGPVNSPHKGPVTRKMFPFDDVIMSLWPCNSMSVNWTHKWFKHIIVCRLLGASTNTDKLAIERFGTNFTEILIKYQCFLSRKFTPPVIQINNAGKSPLE